LEKMGRRKRKKVVLRMAKTIPRIFKCPKCGEVTIRVNMKYKKVKDNRVMVKCGHCGLEQEAPYTDITEPIDAYGDFIDIFYREQEYERLTKREEKLVEKQQYTELVTIYSILADIAQINANKFLEEYEKDKSGEDLKTAEKWKETADKYNKNAQEIKAKLESGELKDAPENAVFDDTTPESFEPDSSGNAPPKKPKKKVSMEDVLDDTGFLEF
jgi:transcription elongation factor Elf1